MGLRLAEDYLFHSSTGRCADLRDVAEALAKVRVASLFYYSLSRHFLTY